MAQRIKPLPQAKSAAGRPAAAKASAKAPLKPGRAPEAPPKKGAATLAEAMAALAPKLGKLAVNTGLELVSAKLATLSGRAAIRLVVDKPFAPGQGPGSQVTIDDCAAFSRLVSRLLDQIYPGDGPEYSLEVSSPGLDRALVTEADFRRFDGALAKVGLIIEGRTVRRVGRLATAAEPWRLLSADEELAFNLEMVKSARLVPEL
jgi:ribosome maturation factor RimP